MTRDSGSSRSDPSGDPNTEQPSADDPLVRLRALCTALPEVTERPSHGEPTWFVRDRKVFVMYADHHHDDRLGFWAAAPEGVQQLLVEAEPGGFYRPPYVGHRGWLGVYLDVDVDWDRVAEIVTDAYRQIAPKRLVAELDRRESESRQDREVGTQ
ncbi:MmcQ/YjbR family DNA-binding protein [Actinopolymorpha singaporensis]|uniref:Predicted DNA-binding protein, MmcQ/YjbR family n=1 Tax=Actinopolymorpha singaporensis TaxID=117157 RepID=A0A1H1YTK8_9ACTN|nr:MmcQ/YjbR family DNA-binding protein [Actinopolymorpha singaporensis]SDT24733.1 Predicted DNA-binding protein, MmcQ/YjbR family [Actinopolymorpha singaporensis]